MDVCYYHDIMLSSTIDLNIIRTIYYRIFLFSIKFLLLGRFFRLWFQGFEFSMSFFDRTKY